MNLKPVRVAHRMVQTRRALACAGVAVVAIATATAAQAATAKAKGSKHGPQLSLAVQGALVSFDPWQSGNGLNGSMLFLGGVYDSLLNVTPKGKIAPGLATSWTQVNSHTIKLKLRSGVKFADGTTFTSASVKANVAYAVADKTPGQCNSDLADVTVQTHGKYAVTLQESAPNPDLLLNLASCAGYMVGPKALANPTSLKGAPDGTGPYTYDQSASVQNQTWVYKKKAKYWNSSLYPYSQITLHFYGTQTATDDASHSGQVQFVQVEPSTDTATGLKLYNTSPNLIRGMALGDLHGSIVPALGDVRVRQAMNYAINRPAILKALYKGDGIVDGASTPFGPGYVGYTKKLDSYYPYDPSKAKQLLAQAGYPHGFTLPAMDSPTDTNAALLQAIAGYEQAIGINMQVTANTTTFIPSMLSGKQPAFFAQFTLSGAEYQNMVGMASSTAFWNPEKASNKLFGGLLAKLQLATPGTKASAALYGRLAGAFAQQAWWVAPVLLPTTEGYNAKKVNIVVTNGNPCPLLYQITPA